MFAWQPFCDFKRVGRKNFGVREDALCFSNDELKLSPNYQNLSRLSKFKIEKSLPAKKVNQENASNFYHVSWPISAMDRVEPSFFALVLMTIKYYKLSFGLLKLSNYLWGYQPMGEKYFVTCMKNVYPNP